MGGHSRHALHHVRQVIGRDPEAFTRGVFTRLFALDPDLRDLFPAQMSHLREAFFGVIDHALEVIPADDGHTDLVELLAQLGRDHRKFGVLPAHYPLMCTALIGEFRAVLDGYWDGDTEETLAAYEAAAGTEDGGGRLGRGHLRRVDLHAAGRGGRAAAGSRVHVHGGARGGPRAPQPGCGHGDRGAAARSAGRHR